MPGVAPGLQRLAFGTVFSLGFMLISITGAGEVALIFF